MKKAFIYLLMAVLLVSMLGLNACGNKAQDAEPEPEPVEVSEAAEDSGDDGMVDGGWSVADTPAVELPEEVRNAFDKAMETLTGSYNEVTPVAYIGRQVVAGNNYAVLCRVTFANEKVPAGLAVVTVYEDLEGNAEVLSTEEFSLADYNTGEETAGDATAGPSVGGWQIPDQITTAEIPEEASSAFNKAVEGFTGNGLTPMALLGTQVVAGTNYAFLCHSRTVTEEPIESIQVVIVYEDLEGNATITGINNVDVSRYVDY